MLVGNIKDDRVVQFVFIAMPSVVVVRARLTQAQFLTDLTINH